MTWSKYGNTGKLMLVSAIAFGALVPAMAVDVNGVSAEAASEMKKISELAIGDTVRFAGKNWVVIDPTTGYVNMSEVPAWQNITPHIFPTKIVKFNPNNPDSEAHWLNTYYYNTMTEEEKAAIIESDWGVGGLSAADIGGQSTATAPLTLDPQALKIKEDAEKVSAKIGQISVSEWLMYSKYFQPTTGVLDGLAINKRTRTHFTGWEGNRFNITGVGFIQYFIAGQQSTPVPAIHLDKGLKVNGQGEVVLTRDEVEPDDTPDTGGGATGNQTATLNLEGGDLTLETSEIKDFGSIKLKNQPQTVTTGFDDKFTVTDNRGTGLGWRLDVSATTFSEVAPVGGFSGGAQTGFTLPIGSLMVNGLDTIERTEGTPGGNPSIAGLSNTVIDGSSLATVSKAGLNEGAGKFALTFGEDALSLVVDSSTAKVDTLNYPSGATPYESTVTWDLVSAP